MSASNGAAEARYFRFPPKWRLVLVPTAPRSATAQGMTMYTASKPIPLAAQRVLWLAARLAGARVVPGARERWVPPMPIETFDRLRAQIAEKVGGEIDGLAIYERPQSARAALTMLFCRKHAPYLVRVRQDQAGLALEQLISEQYTQRPVPTFRVPRSLGHGALDGWHWIAYEAMSRTPHAPVRRVTAELLAGITDLVEQVLPQPPESPSHWRGAHADLTPWNLRRTRSGIWLIDWEDACWAPPHADQVYFSAVTRATRPGPVRPPASDPQLAEAIEYWRKIVSARRGQGQDDRLRSRILRALGDS